MDLFIEFHRLVMHSWSSSKSLCGSDLALFLTGGLTRDCAMSVHIGVFCGFVPCVSSYCNVFLKQRQTLRIFPGSIPHWGADSRLCDECAMRILTQNHLLESTAQIVACLKQNLCSVHEAGKPPVRAKQSWSFWVGWPFNGEHSRVEAWPSNQKAPTLLRTYGLEVAS